MPTCLIIDDVTVTRFAARTFLEELNVTVKEAQDKETALASLEEEKVDVLLLDWHLKKESGLDVLQSVRKKYGDKIKVIVFSGVEGENKASEIISYGANGYIPKPTTKEKIEAELKKNNVL